MAEEELKAYREKLKSWKELTDSEKIERMRDVVKKLQRRAENLETQVVVNREHVHQHGRVWYPHPNSFSTYETGNSIGEWF